MSIHRTPSPAPDPQKSFSTDKKPSTRSMPLVVAFKAIQWLHQIGIFPKNLWQNFTAFKSSSPPSNPLDMSRYIRVSSPSSSSEISDGETILEELATSIDISLYTQKTEKAPLESIEEIEDSFVEEKALSPTYLVEIERHLLSLTPEEKKIFIEKRLSFIEHTLDWLISTIEDSLERPDPDLIQDLLLAASHLSLKIYPSIDSKIIKLMDNYLSQIEEYFPELESDKHLYSFCQDKLLFCKSLLQRAMPEILQEDPATLNAIENLLSKMIVLSFIENNYIDNDLVELIHYYTEMISSFSFQGISQDHRLLFIEEKVEFLNTIFSQLVGNINEESLQDTILIELIHKVTQSIYTLSQESRAFEDMHFLQLIDTYFNQIQKFSKLFYSNDIKDQFIQLQLDFLNTFLNEIIEKMFVSPIENEISTMHMIENIFKKMIQLSLQKDGSISASLANLINRYVQKIISYSATLEDEEKDLFLSKKIGFFESILDEFLDTLFIEEPLDTIRFPSLSQEKIKQESTNLIALMGNTLATLKRSLSQYQMQFLNFLSNQIKEIILDSITKKLQEKYAKALQKTSTKNIQKKIKEAQISPSLEEQIHAALVLHMGSDELSILLNEYSHAHSSLLKSEIEEELKGIIDKITDDFVQEYHALITG